MTTRTQVALATIVAAIALSSCSGGSQEARPADSADDSPVVADHTQVDPIAPTGPSADRFAQGETVFNQLCTACHTVQPPPNLAPPMMAIAGFYHQAFDDRDKAVAAIADWVANPSADKSLVPAMAIERFGLMAPLPLPDSSLQAVAEWVWDMYDPAVDPHAGGGMGGMEGMEGMGPGGGMGGMGGGMGGPGRMRRMHAPGADTASSEMPAR